MFGPTKPEPPPRKVWADTVQVELAVMAKEYARIHRDLKSLQDLETSIKAECNHTFKDGTSALVENPYEDPYDYNGSAFRMTCTVCGT